MRKVSSVPAWILDFISLTPSYKVGAVGEYDEERRISGESVVS